MNPSADISQEELVVFLQETEEQLQLLDEDFITLEKEGANVEVLQEIFRAAHTIKGSSAMLGLDAMSQVGHAMETVLDRLRNGTLEVSTPVIDALLYGLDMLRSLKNDLVSGQDTSTGMESVVAGLEKVAGDSTNSGVTKVNEAIAPNTEELEKLKRALAVGHSAYRINVEVDPDSSWAAVRFFQITSELSQWGEVIDSVPSHEDIEKGEVDHTLALLLTSSQDASALEDALSSVPDIVGIEIIPSSLEQVTSAAAVSDGASKPGGIDVRTPKLSGTSSPKLAQISQTVRVDVKLLDRFMNLVGEMVIDRNRIGQIGKVLESKYEGDETVSALGETSAHIMKIVNELQQNVLKARMLPIGTVFNGLPRLVRDLTQKAGKKVDFIIKGQETELDRTIIEQIRDPLLHLLRNAVDHGIESPEKRKSAGKPDKATICLAAYQEQNHIFITVEDDGGGIDAAEVRDTLVEKGLISVEEATRLTDTETINLIFRSGISTAKKVTQVSGRGVGMDVVKTNIEAIDGSVSLETKVGQGTKFTIRLPLTLATIDGLMVTSNDAVYVIPMASMVEVVKLEAGQIKTIMGKEVIRLRDNILPLLRLDKEFGHGMDGTRHGDGTLVAVVRAGDKTVGVAVDSVMEPQETVVKSVGKYIGSVAGVAGATILGDGRVALILDTTSLVKEAIGH